MRKAAEILVLLLGLAAAPAATAQEQERPDCAALTLWLGAVRGYELTAPPAAPQDGWCVLDGATLRSQTPGLPNLYADRLRLASTPGRIMLEIAGLRVAPRLGDTAVNDRLRSMFRLQTADIGLTAVEEPDTGVLRLEGVTLRLSGGSELAFEAEIRGARLAPAAIAAGSLTRLAIDWRNDGRLLRPIMELAGEGMRGAQGGQAVDAAREALAGVVGALPDAALEEGSRRELRQAVAALPQGRGRLSLLLEAPDGIGAARLGIAAMSRDPLGPEALARLFARTEITADWQPGIAP